MLKLIKFAFLALIILLINNQGNNIFLVHAASDIPTVPTLNASHKYPVIAAANADKLTEIATICAPADSDLCGYALQWSPDSKYLVVEGDKSIYLYDTDDWAKPSRQIKFKHSYGDVIFSPDFQTFLVLYEDWTAELWDFKTGKKRFTFPSKDLNVGWVHFSPDGKQLASFTNDYAIRVWNVNPLRQWHTWKSGQQQDFIGVFSPDSSLFAISGDSTVRGFSIQLWRIKTNEHFADLKYDEDAIISSIRFSPNGHLLSVSTFFNNTIWNIDTLRKQYVFDMPFKYDWALYCTFSPDSKILACLGKERIYLWDLYTGKQITMFDGLGFISNKC